MRNILVVLVLLLKFPAFAQSTDVYEWYDGDVRHEMRVQRGLVAEFGADTTAAANGLQKLSGTAPMKKSGTTKIFRLDAAGAQKLSAAGATAKQSPVFAESASGGTLRALPGGIFVTFKENQDEAWIRTWAERNGLEFQKLLPSGDETSAAFQTPAGLAALETANRVRILPDVASARPNWWTEKWRGSLGLKEKSPAEIQRAQSERDRLSRRFREP